MNKNKIRKLFAVAVISGALMTGLNSAAYAVVTDYAIKVNDQLYSYSEGEVKRSFLDYKRNKPAKLYEDFATKLKDGNGFYAFKDDKKGFIPYKTLEKGLIEAKRGKQTFDIDKVIEKDDCKAVEINSVKQVKLSEKNEILVKDAENISNKNDDKAKKEEVVSTTSTSKSSGGSSSRGSSSSRSSSGSSSSKKNKEEVKKVVSEVKKEEKKELDKKVQAEKKKEEVKVQPAKEEKKPEVKENINKDVIPVVNNEKDKKVPSDAKGFEASIKEDSKRVVKEAEKPESVVSKAKGNVSIKSEITQTAQKPHSAQKQITTILIDGEAKADETIEILDHKIEIKKGDNPYRITAKIEKEFKNNKVWEVKYRYGQWEGKGNITFYAREFAQDVKITVNPSNINGVIFKVKNEQFGELAIGERGEVCTATVLNDSTADEKIKVKVASDVINTTFAIVEVEVKAGETKEKIAEKIANKLKEDKTITKYFTVENKGVQVNLTQKHADAINTAITVQNDSNVGKIEVKPVIKKEKGQPQVEVKKEESKEKVVQPKETENKKNKNEEVVDNKAEKKPEGSVKKAPSMAEQLKQYIKVDSRRVVKEVEKPEDRSSTKGNISIKSEITQTSQKPHMAQKQMSTIFVEGEAKVDGTIEILGHKIEMKKGDNYYRVVNKIEKEFKDDKVWDVKYRYGQWGEMGNITFHAREFAENVDITVNPSNQNGLTFEVKNDQCGELAISERKETCTATVLNDSISDGKIKIKVHSDVINKTFAIVEVEIKKGETKEQVAENIANKLKKDNTITQYLTVENKAAQVNLIQKHADVLNLSVTVE